MRSLFLVMIPSITVAAEIVAKEPVDSNNVFMATFHSLLAKLGSINKGLLVIEVIVGLLIVLVAFAFITNRYQKQKLRSLKTADMWKMVGLFIFCIVTSFAFCPWDKVPPYLIIPLIFIALALYWVVANYVIYFCLSLMVRLNVREESGLHGDAINKKNEIDVELCRKKIKRIFLKLRRWFCFRAIEDDEKISSETLYFAVRCLKSLLDSLANINGRDNDIPDIPEFHFVISGDTELLKELPTSTPYDILHFIELQSLWASVYNERQRKIQWRQEERAKFHCQINQDIRTNPGKSSEEFLAKELHQRLAKIYEDWQPIPMYYAKNKDDKSGIMMDTMILEAVKQWNDRLPNNIIPVYTASLTRAIRVLFSSEQDLVDSAKQIALTSSIGLPLPKKEIVNIWIPIEDLSLFASVMHWANGTSTKELLNKFITPPRISGKKASTKLTFVEVVNNFMEDHHLGSNGSGLSDIIEKEFGKSDEQKKFMFLFIGNRMEKKDYRQKHPEIYTEEDKRRSCSNRHLAHLLVILMALYHKKALPFLRVIDNVCNERKNNAANFLERQEEKTRECISRIRTSMENKRGLS